MIKIRNFLSKFYLDFLCFFLLLLLSPLYFFNLDNLSLVSWDEAWYGAIARNISEGGDPLVLWWNGNVYADHPPAGFWVIALFQSVFGINEFGTRVGSAVFGMAGLFLTYLLGKELFSKTVGLISALALSSTYWYIYRARSGNLDIFLTVFFIATFYFAFKSLKNAKFLVPFAVSFGLLLLTKSVIPLTIIPSLLIIFFGSKLKFQDTKKAVFIFLLVTIPWFAALRLQAPNSLSKYFLIGAPGVGSEQDYLKNFNQIKEYLHFGVGKWFWPGVIGVVGGLVSFNRGLLAMSVFCISFFVPFVLSEKGQIWHLIPLYPFLTLGFFGFSENSGKIVIKKLFKRYEKVFTALLIAGLAGFSIYFSWMQIKRS
ncbi:glycosyltransferase family 39 protein, partial [Candidatus Daviesbacteria bacterium]|nr:glycosyltransferase family 39 protein [Candidatus Daviesbacteria bacterium]